MIESQTSPIILALETATLGGSVFLGRGAAELAAKVGNPDISHSNTLLSDINECLQQARVTLSDVELFACASGPGSFTGLRIGIATLKALAATLERPCIGIPTLNAVAHAAGSSETTIALLPAGRGEVFAQMFSVSDSGTVTIKDSACHLSPARLMERYAAVTDVTWAGSGAHAQRAFIAEQARQRGLSFIEQRSQEKREVGWRLAQPTTNLAQHVAALALLDFDKGNVQSAQSLSAIYVRPSDPELKEQCR